MGQILFCQAKKPLNKGFFLCSLMPLQSNYMYLKLMYKKRKQVISRNLSLFVYKNKEFSYQE